MAVSRRNLATRVSDALRGFTRGLDAAGGGRRWKDDRSASMSAGAIHSDASTIARRAAHFAVNDPHGARMVESLTGNLVGTGIVPRPMHPDESRRRRLALAFTAWTDEADADARGDFFALQAALTRDMVAHGEAIAIFTADPATGAPQLRRLHPEQLARETTRRLENGGEIVQGVEFDRLGRRVAYHIRAQAPGATLAGIAPPIRLPVGEAVHLFRPLFPGQVRGLSWFAPVLVAGNELAQLMDAQLVRAKVASLHVGAITSADGTVPYEGTQSGAEFEASLEPGALLMLPGGTDIKFSDVPDQGGVTAFAEHIVRMLAAGAGISYEMLSGDYSRTNYSSARAASLEFRRFAESVQHHVIVFQLCRPTWLRFIRWSVLNGTIPATLYQRERAQFEAVSWLPPKWDWVDPLKDGKAEIELIRAGLKSRSQSVAERGYDIETLDAEIAADQARAERLGLRLQPSPPTEDSDAANADA